MESPILVSANPRSFMDKKSRINLTVGKFEPLVFFKVLFITLLIVGGTGLLGGFVLEDSATAMFERLGIYRFLLLPVFLAGGIAWITRHSTLTVTQVGKKQLGSLIAAAIESEGYVLKKDKDRVMHFTPVDSGMMKLNQWMENMNVTVRFKNGKMTVVGPRRIINNLEDVVRFNKVFKQALLEV